jgi:protein SCO1/2
MPLSSRARRLIVPLAAFVLGLGILSVALVLTLSPGKPMATSAVGGPFALVDHNGRAVTEKDFAGRPFLVFFGFTHCPDVCPTTLLQLSEMLKATGSTGQNLRALFISVDPERDTPEAMKSYVSSFDERIVGLTGDRASVDAAIKTFRAFARKVPTSGGDYTMEHTSAVYLMGADGQLIGTVNLNRPPEEAARDILKRI